MLQHDLSPRWPLYLFMLSSISYQDPGIILALECGANEVFVPNHSISLVTSNLFSDFENILSQLPLKLKLCWDFNVCNSLLCVAHLDANVSH